MARAFGSTTSAWARSLRERSFRRLLDVAVLVGRGRRLIMRIDGHLALVSRARLSYTRLGAALP